MERDIRIKDWLHNMDPDVREMMLQDEYNPKLYLPNKDWKPPVASLRVESAIRSFSQQLIAKQHEYQQVKGNRNLTQLQCKALRALTNHDKIIIIEADKNMGVTVWNREDYIKQALSEHLNNPQVYENVTPRIEETIWEVNDAFERFQKRHGCHLDRSVLTFFYRAQKLYGDKLAVFRATAKVHKNPVMYRPVVAKCGTAIEAVSKWLDCEFQKLRGEIPWTIRDSDSFRQEVIQLELPPNARLVTFDAVAMYSNIDLNHAMQVMKRWWESYDPGVLGESLAPTNTMLSALNLVMRHNIMQFGDSYFKQLVGTAMGTSCAVEFANLYFGLHEKEGIRPQFMDILKRITFYKRLVDDTCFIWLGDTDAAWDNLVNLFNNWGILKWDINLPSSSVDFLDLTLTVVNGRIVTKTYQKPNNPHLYLPPHSAHPSSLIYGTIYGLLRTYYRQNSKFEDFVAISRLLYLRHLRQGWDQAVLREVFLSALNKLKSKLEAPAPLAPADPVPPESRLFFHMEYHPKDIPRREVRKIFAGTLEAAIREESGIEQFTIAYSKPTTIGSVIAKAQLHQEEGYEVSKYITGERP